MLQPEKKLSFQDYINLLTPENRDLLIRQGVQEFTDFAHCEMFKHYYQIEEEEK